MSNNSQTLDEKASKRKKVPGDSPEKKKTPAAAGERKRASSSTISEKKQRGGGEEDGESPPERKRASSFSRAQSQQGKKETESSDGKKMPPPSKKKDSPKPEADRSYSSIKPCSSGGMTQEVDGEEEFAEEDSGTCVEMPEADFTQAFSSLPDYSSERSVESTQASIKPPLAVRGANMKEALSSPPLKTTAHFDPYNLPAFRRKIPSTVKQLPASFTYRQHIVHVYIPDVTPRSVMGTPRPGAPNTTPPPSARRNSLGTPSGLSVSSTSMLSSLSTKSEQSPLSKSPPEDEDTSYTYDALPEGLLTSELSPLCASFSAAPSRFTDDQLVVTSVDVAEAQHGHGAVLFGDIFGRITLYAEGITNPSYGGWVKSPFCDRLQRQLTHQAYVAEVDCLKSVHIDERIKCVKFLPPRSPHVTAYLAANERTIKLFRIKDTPHMIPPRSNQLWQPPRRSSKVVPSRAFTNMHQWPIHSLSLCADGDTFLSADDFRVMWWYLEAEDTTKANLLVDVKPNDVDDATELLTSSRFHPTHASMFCLTSSNGTCRIGDLRDPPTRTARNYVHVIQQKPEFAPIQCEHDDILASVCDGAFLGSDYVVTRDYLTLKLWDLRNTSAPANVCFVMEHLAPFIDEVYDNDAIFDRFQVSVDHFTSTVATGMYNGEVVVWNPRKSNSQECIEYYQCDPFVPPSESENNGRIEKPAVVTKAALSGNVYLKQRVTCVALNEGASRLVVSTDTEHLFLFDHLDKSPKPSPKERQFPQPPPERKGNRSIEPNASFVCENSSVIKVVEAPKTFAVPNRIQRLHSTISSGSSGKDRR